MQQQFDAARGNRWPDGGAMQGLRFDLTRLSRISIGLLWLSILAEVAFAAQSYSFLRFLDAADAGVLGGAELDAAAAAAEIDRWGMFVSYGYIAVFVLTSAFVGVWVYRASWNARQIQPSHDRITPGWAVGWFFVPIMSLWKPYQAMVQTGNSSQQPNGNMDDSPPTFVQVWWFFWVTSSLGGNFSFRLSMKAETVEDFRFVTQVDLILAPISIISAYLFIRVILTITAAQRDKRPALPLPEILPSEEGKLA